LVQSAPCETHANGFFIVAPGFERSKPFVGAAGPVAVFKASSAISGVEGARYAARRHGEVFFGARRHVLEARGRVAKFSSARGGGRGRRGL